MSLASSRQIRAARNTSSNGNRAETRRSSHESKTRLRPHAILVVSYVIVGTRMNELPAPDFPLPYPHEQHPPKKVQKRYKSLVLAFVAVGLVLVAATSAYLWMYRSNEGTTSTKRSVTYYYRDGKTVLWQGSRLAEADSPTFVHAVADELLARYGEKTMKKGGDWNIVTTLDQSLQQVAAQQVEAQRQQMDRQRAKDAALVAQEVATGQIVSWVGSVEDTLTANGKDRLRSVTEP